jgi:hypothetical protein
MAGKQYRHCAVKPEIIRCFFLEFHLDLIFSHIILFELSDF